jgi:cytochrome c551
VLPLILFVAVSGTAFALAKLHLAKPGVPKATGAVKVGDAYRGETVFQEKCAGCHGDRGKGGGIGPKLQGDPISLARAQAQIEAGGGAMPANLVTGRDKEDVLAFLATILAKSG